MSSGARLAAGCLLGALAMHAAAGSRASEPGCSAARPDGVTLRADPFDRTRHSADAYVLGAGGTPAASLARYRLATDGAIVDVAGAPLGDASGATRGAARGLWTTAPTLRHFYTDLVPGPVRDARNALGASTAAPAAALRPAAVALASYGGMPGRPDAADAVVFVATDAGFLAALDARSGAELWTFAPRAALAADLRDPRHPAPNAGSRGGVVRTLALDRNQDGIIDATAGDRVLVVYGSERAGGYFAFDVTARTAPLLLWHADRARLPALGAPQSAPALARLRNAVSAANPAGLVAVVSGGAGGGARAGTGAGNALYVLDALDGTLLFAAGGEGSGATERLEAMTHAISAGVRALDLDGDGYADRLYAADTAGQVWRFDIEAEAPRGALAHGRVFAALGATPGHAAAAGSGFYHAPDAALATAHGQRFLTLSLASGDAAAPSTAREALYVLRDYDLALGGAVPPAAAALTAGDLADARAPRERGASAGWRLLLDAGERASGAARTFAGHVYQLAARAGTSGCERGPAPRLYVLDVASGELAARDLPRGAGPLQFAFPPAPAGLPGRPAPVCLAGLVPCGRPASPGAVAGVWRAADASP